MHIWRNTAHNNKELINFGLSVNVVLVCIFVWYCKELKSSRKSSEHILYIWTRLLSSSRNVLLKLSETTSPSKLFPSDCITLYWNTPHYYTYKWKKCYSGPTKIDKRVQILRQELSNIIYILLRLAIFLSM